MRRLIAASAAIVAVTAWWLGSFAVTVVHRVDSHTYPVDFKGARWIRASDAGPHSYFRLQFTLDQAAESGVLWIDADQVFKVYANGISLGNDSAAVRLRGAPLTRFIDIGRVLQPGANVLAVEVTNSDDRPAALRAVLDLRSAGSEHVEKTGVGSWRATSDVSKVRFPTSITVPTFFSVDFNDSAWGGTTLAAVPHGDSDAAVPQSLVEQPWNAAVIGSPAGASDIVVSTAIDLAQAPSDGWIRIVAGGSYTLFLDGSPVTTVSTDPATQSGPVQPTQLLNIGPLLHRGHNVIALRVNAVGAGAVYVDGGVVVDGRSVSIATDTSWAEADVVSASALGSTPGRQAALLGDATSRFPLRFGGTIVTAGQVSVPAGLVIPLRALIAVLVVMEWLLGAVLLRLVARMRFADAACLAGLATLPVAVAIAAVRETAGLVDTTPPYPYTRGILAVLLTALVLGHLVTAAVAAGVPGRVASWLNDRLEPGRRPAPVYQFRVRPGSRRAGERGAGDALALAWGAGGVHGPLDRVRPWLASRVNAYVLGIGALVGTCGAMVGYKLGYEPYWQDELASLTAARAMRLHGIPRLPSGVLYWKGELYHATIAIVGAIVGDAPAQLRAVSVAWFMATVLAFAFLLLPMVMGRGRRWLCFGLCVLFATAPAELSWARDVRMYQQAQFFVILIVVLMYRALHGQRTRTIALAFASCLAMYWSHEESFVYLIAVAVVVPAVLRTRLLRDWRWPVFGGGSAALIAGHYLLTLAAQPRYLGYDHSNAPYIMWNTHDAFWYLNNVFFPAGSGPGTLLMVSTLAVLATLVGVVRRNRMRIYLAAMLWIPVLALGTVFTPKISRYAFVTFPVLFVLGGLGAGDVLAGIRRSWSSVAHTARTRAAVSILMASTAAGGFVWIAVSLTHGVGDYGPAAARLAGVPVMHTTLDYDRVIATLNQQRQPGDVVLTLCPPNIAAYYMGRVPDVTIATGRDKMLYLMERNGTVVDTNFGQQSLLNTADLMRYLASHRRVWLVTDLGKYFRQVPVQMRQLILAQFREVSEGSGAALYLYGG